MSSKEILIKHLHECINTELSILHHVSQCVPKSERELVNKSWIISETRKSIDRCNDILKELK